MRFVVFIVAIVGAYLFLHGWPGAPAALMRACLAVATLVAGLVFWTVSKSTPGSRMSCSRKANWIDYVALGSLLLAVEILFVGLTNGLAAPAEKLVTRWGGQWNNVSLIGEKDVIAKDESIQTSSGNMLGDELQRNLPKQSDIRPSNKPEVFLELENTEDAQKLLDTRVHLRAFAFSAFDGEAWSAVKQEPEILNEPVIFPQNSLSEESLGRKISYSIHRSSNHSGQNLFVAMPGTLSTSVAPLKQVTESIYMLPSLVDSTDGYNYAVVSKPVHFSDLLEKNIIADQGAEYELSVPSQTAAGIQETVQRFHKLPNLTEKLTAIRNHLRSEYTYSLRTNNPEGSNPLENFLHQEKRGSCELFASAAAMYCRSLGVPSRMAYGWSGGRLYRAANMFVFRAKDAHAWTEIKIEGYGWVVFDTTPPDHEQIPETHEAPEDEPAPDPAEYTKQPESSEPNKNKPYASADKKWLIPKALSAVIVIFLISAFMLLWRYLKRMPLSPDRTRHQQPEASYLKQFRRACSLLGHPMPPGRTLRQQLNILEHTDYFPEFGSELLNYHYGIMYGNKSANQAKEKSLVKSICKWLAEKV